MTLFNQKKAFPLIVLLLLSESTAALSTLPNITFYGRVIDQHGQPVKEAQVWYEATNTYLSAGGGRGEVQTDEQGYFEIDSVGASLTLGGIGNPANSVVVSYPPPEFGNNTTWGGVYYTQVRFLSHKDKQGIYPTWRDHTDKDKAYIVNAWRLGQYEGTIGKNLRAGYSRTGSTYTINMLGQNYKQIILDGEQPGHLRVSCTRESMNNASDYGDWTVHIAPINGGIQKTNNLYMNLAPETGYQSSLNIIMHKADKDYQHKILNKRYYFMSNDGREYGSLFVNFEPHSRYEDDRFCIIDISYKINSTGSRNLELRKDNSSG